jgi:hypothetical protein
MTVLGLGLLAMSACGKIERSSPLSPAPPGPSTPAPPALVSVRVEGTLLDADTGTPVPGVLVRSTQVNYVGGAFPVNQREGVTSDENGVFGFNADLPLGWYELILETSRDGYERRTVFVDNAPAVSEEIRLIPSVTIRPGEALQLRVFRFGNSCFFESWPCRRIVIESPPGVLVDVEVIPTESDVEVGIEGPLGTHPSFPPLKRRITVAGGEIWLYGADVPLMLTAALHR